MDDRSFALLVFIALLALLSFMSVCDRPGTKIVTEYCHKDFCYGSKATYQVDFEGNLNGVSRVILDMYGVTVMTCENGEYIPIYKEMNKVRVK